MGAIPVLQAAPNSWLLLVHQLPQKPATLRVRVWRRLQSLGAVAVKASVYALPAGEQTQEDFQWLLKEIVDGGGEAVICEARLVDGLSDRQVQALFEDARAKDYDALGTEVRQIAEACKAAGRGDAKDFRGQLARLRRRFAQTCTIDFFGAEGRETVEGLLSELEETLSDELATNPARPARGALTSRTWVTRQGVHVDRIACAWLIRRFIDPEATFKFVPAKGYAPKPGELRFDMFEAEFTHQGDRCSFEVLLAHADLHSDPALRAIGEIVHDIDLKDGKFGREATGGIAQLIAGICMAHQADEQRIARGTAVLNDLYEFFRSQPPS